MNSSLKIIKNLGKETKKRKFGQVALVKDLSLNQYYIRKHAHLNALSPQAFQQIQNEASFSFYHPFLPKVIKIISDKTEYTILLEAKKGINLQEYWKNTTKKERLNFTKKWVAKLVVLLDYIHGKSIYHCDIKPSNLIIEQTNDSDNIEFNLHLIDFGLAIQKNRVETMQRKLIFPLGFAAPEQILNQLDLIDSTSDYFAIGISVFFLWTGQLPLTHPNPSIFTNLQIAHPLLPHPNLPHELFKWINKVCVKPTWLTSPNRMSKNTIKELLQEAMYKRYHNSTQLIDALMNIENKKMFFFR